jgi:hypothetical protein
MKNKNGVPIHLGLVAGALRVILREPEVVDFLFKINVPIKDIEALVRVLDAIHKKATPLDAQAKLEY